MVAALFSLIGSIDTFSSAPDCQSVRRPTRHKPMPSPLAADQRANNPPLTRDESELTPT